MIKKIGFSFLGIILSVQRVLAIESQNPLGSTNPKSGGFTNPLTFGSIEELLEGLSNWAIIISSPIAALMIIVGAYQLLFSGGDPEKVKTGRQTILYTVIAYAIILLAWALAHMVAQLIGARTS